VGHLRAIVTGAAIAALAASATACERAADSTAKKVVVVDQGEPHRVVSLTPSATEVVAALGATSTLIGVDDYSTYPPEVTALPKVGSFLSPNLEAIAALHPTLVIVDDIHGGTAKALGELGIHVLACPMHALPDVKAALTKVGAALDREAIARARVEAIDAALDAAAAARPAVRPRVLLIIDRGAGLTGLVAAGPGSWLDELLAVVGGENVLAGAVVRYPKISREEILMSKPDVIIDASYVANAADPGKDWAGVAVPAVTGGRVRAAKQPYMLAPSPRVAEALADVAALLK
jgi:iron complex transport system substrate-binding protein